MCFTKPVKHSYSYFAAVFPITQGKQTVTESILSRKTIRNCTSLWLPWWHTSPRECLLANPRAMQMRKRHKVLVRILLCTLTAAKKISILSFLLYLAFPVKQGLFCFIVHERLPSISLRNGSWPFIRLGAMPGFLVCLFTSCSTELQLHICETTATLVMKEAVHIV